MIKQLYIRNFAIIEEIQISFQEGLTIITGETGAGKSILIGALSLILGDRADSQAIFNPSEKCILEGVFDISTIKKAQLFLQQHDLLEGDELIIRREMTSQGKSRVFINDTPSTLSVLQPLAHLLIDLHRQFDTIELQQEQSQLLMVDQLCANEKLLEEYQQTYGNWKLALQAYEKLIEQNRLIKQELDYNQFLFQELESFQAKPNEIEEAENEIDILNNSEALKSSLQKVLFHLSDADEPLVSVLKTCIQSLEPFAKKINFIAPLLERLQSSLIELKDISSEIDAHFNGTNYDEERINELNDRINEGNRLLKKHHVQSTNELIKLHEELATKILTANHADEAEETLKLKSESYFKQACTLAETLSKARKKIAPSIEDNVGKLLKKVGMPNAQLKLSIHETNINAFGFDKVEFLFDANKTGKFQPISKVASGGELSRLMLCIKSMLAKSTSLATLVFDEIDTGISGETAIQVGQIMKELASKHQLICITHLPQIASKANQHIYIYKEANAKGNFTTKLKTLENEDRINVLAEMLSGKEVNENSKEMVKSLMK